MKIAVDISYYPLVEEFKIPIKAFIAKLESIEDIEIEKNSMSTQIRGEHSTLMPLLTEKIIEELESYRASFVIKIIKGE
jgi:uncharacterized protein YqgV (UPF0045/DUF77 family)